MRSRPLTLVLAAWLTLLATGARAQERADDPLAPARLDPLQLDRAYRWAQARRNVGIGLAAPGMALGILGAVLIVYGANDPHLFGGGAEIAAGSVSAGVGVALGVPGVVLWILGQDDMDVVSWRKLQLNRRDPPR
jgi:hypothetical protein